MTVPGGQEQDAVLSAEQVRAIAEYGVIPREHRAREFVANLAASHEALRVRADQAAEERDYFQSRLGDFSAVAAADFARAERARAEAESLRQTLREAVGIIDRWDANIGQPPDPPDAVDVLMSVRAVLAAADATQERNG